MSYFKLDFTVMDSDPELSSINELSDEEEADTLLDRLPPPPIDRTHAARQGGRLIKPKERKHILLAIITAIVFSTQFACRGYLNGVISTIQHSLDVSQAEAWLIDIAFDIGVIVGIVILLLCGRCTKLNRPRCVTGGALLLGAGLFASSVPYFMLHPSPTWLSSPVASTLPAYELCDVGLVPPDEGDDNDDGLSDYIQSLGGKELAIICGMLVAGLGAAPQWMCGFPYLQDRTQKHPIAIVTLYLVTSVLGRWAGELLAFIIERNTEPMSSYGAVSRWWLGFLLLGLNGFLMALILIVFNDVPEGGRSKDEQRGRYGRLNSTSSSTIGNNDQSAAGVIGSPMGAPDQTDSFYYMRLDDVGNAPSSPSSAKENCCSIYKQFNVVLLCIATSFEAAILTGFLVFQPRFYGVITGMGLFEAGFYFSTAVLMGVLIGIIIGVAVCLLMKPSVTYMWKITWIMCLVTMGVTWVLFLYTCEEAPVNAYQPNPELSTKADDLSRWVDLNQTCSSPCGCPNNAWHPVCGSDHVTYISPCLAGCQELKGTTQFNFTNCLCIEGANNQTSGSAVGGPCPASCKPLWTQLLAVFFIFLLTGVNFPIIVLLVSGTVKVHRRSQSLAMLVLMWHLLGVLPAIGIFNAVLGQACSLWQSTEEFVGQHYSDCLMYHVEKHHFFFISLVLLLKALALVFYVVSYRATVKIKEAEEEVVTNRNWIGFNGERASVELGRVDQGRKPSTSVSSPTFL